MPQARAAIPYHHTAAGSSSLHQHPIFECLRLWQGFANASYGRLKLRASSSEDASRSLINPDHHIANVSSPLANPQAPRGGWSELRHGFARVGWSQGARSELLGRLKLDRRSPSLLRTPRALPAAPGQHVGDASRSGRTSKTPPRASSGCVVQAQRAPRLTHILRTSQALSPAPVGSAPSSCKTLCLPPRTASGCEQ